MNHAEELGIDLEQLEKERFGTVEHYRMVKAHIDKVRAYEINKLYLEASEQMAALIEDGKPKAKVKRKAKNQKRRQRKQGGSYDFTDRQLEIAIQSIERHADYK